MMGIIIAIHIIACMGLIFFILIQSGKGGGLIESFTSADSIFGTKTNAFITKTTTGFAITFFITCLLLAFLSVQQSKSIVQREIMKQPAVNTAGTQGIVEETAEETTDSAAEGTGTAAETAEGAAQEAVGEAETAQEQIPETTEVAAPETTEVAIPEMAEKSAVDNLPAQTENIDQTQKNNAATEQSAATP